jgi:hypothetical protein
MELDDFKSMWAKYDKKLSANLKFNEELLRRMSIDKSKRVLLKPIYIFYTKVLIIFIFFVFVLNFSLGVIEQPIYCITGFTSAFISLIYGILTILKIKRYQGIEYSNSSIIELQLEIASLKIYILRLRKFELILIVPFLVSFMAICFKSSGIDIYSNIRFFIIELVIALAMCVVLYFWYNKYLYVRKLNEAEQYLKEIERFKFEE